MRGYRSRNESGPLRAKPGNTLVGTIERHYGVDLGVRSDMRLDTLKARTGQASLNDILHGGKGK